MNEESLLFIGQEPALADELLRLFRQQPALQLHPCLHLGSLPSLLKRLRPRVVLLGTDMLLAADSLDLQKILNQKGAPPILFVHNPATLSENRLLQAALSWGAFDIVSLASPDWQQLLLQKIELILPLGRQTQRIRHHTQFQPPTETEPLRLVLMGASTGGPQALASILAHLPKDFSVPILVVQHLPGTWTASLAERLNNLSPLKVREARALDQLQAGTALVVPGNQQVSILRSGKLNLYHKPELNSPSVDLALASACEAFGSQLLAVILTGMGNDGLEGVRQLKQAKGKCLAEHASSCVVYGMPRAVIEAGLADRVIPLERIAQEIQRLSSI